jgi:hypothetical protein
MKMRKFKLLKRSVPLWVVLLICAVAVSSVIAAVYFTLPIPSAVQVKSYEIEFWNEAKTAQITSFDFGVLQQSDEATSPAGYVKNVGDANVWFAWVSDNLPSDFTLKAEYYNSGSSSWVDWNSNSFGTGPNDTPGLAPGAFCQFKIRFTLQNVNATSGNYNFDVTLKSADSMSG